MRLVPFPITAFLILWFSIWTLVFPFSSFCAAVAQAHTRLHRSKSCCSVGLSLKWCAEDYTFTLLFLLLLLLCLLCPHSVVLLFASLHTCLSDISLPLPGRTYLVTQRLIWLSPVGIALKCAHKGFQFSYVFFSPSPLPSLPLSGLLPSFCSWCHAFVFSTEKEQLTHAHLRVFASSSGEGSLHALKFKQSSSFRELSLALVCPWTQGAMVMGYLLSLPNRLCRAPF